MTSDPKAYQVSAKLPKNTSFGQLLSNKLKTLHNETQNKQPKLGQTVHKQRELNNRSCTL